MLRGNRIVVPEKLRSRTLSLAHEGHLGIVGTKQNLQVEKFCKNCHGCQITSKDPKPEPIRTTRLPSGPWCDLAVDFLGPLPSGESILVVVDYYSRWYKVAFMKSTTAEKIIQELGKMFFTHGLPRTIRLDNGPQFVSKEFSDFCSNLGIEHCRVILKWPQANGEVERKNASLMKRIKISCAENKDMLTEVYKYMSAYRVVANPATGKSPSELLYGRQNSISN